MLAPPGLSTLPLALRPPLPTRMTACPTLVTLLLPQREGEQTLVRGGAHPCGAVPHPEVKIS